MQEKLWVATKVLPKVKLVLPRKEGGTYLKNKTSVISFEASFKHISWSFIDLPRCWLIKGFRAKPLSKHNEQGQKRLDPNDASFCCDRSLNAIFEEAEAKVCIWIDNKYSEVKEDELKYVNAYHNDFKSHAKAS